MCAREDSSHELRRSLGLSLSRHPDITRINLISAALQSLNESVLHELIPDFGKQMGGPPLYTDIYL